jgi:hydrogenase-4 component F
MSGAFPFIMVLLPLLSAVALSLIASWRISAWVNVATASLQFVVGCGLAAWANSPATQPVLLTAFVAMTTSWFGHRDIAASLSARALSRRRVRLYHAGYQALVFAMQLALLAQSFLLDWMALAVAVAAAATVTGAVRGSAAAAAVSRIVRHCGVGLAVALLGTVLLHPAPGLAGVLFVVGYGAVGGLLPLSSWSVNAAGESVTPGAIMVTLVANVPVALFMRLQITAGVLIAFGLVALVASAVTLFANLDRRRLVALAGTVQLGIAVVAIGLGATQIASLSVTLLTLVRTAVLQSRCTDIAAWSFLTLLPVYALALLAAPAAAVAMWLLIPLAAGVLLAVWALGAQQPLDTVAIRLAVSPIWLQLALVALLAMAIPGMVGWFGSAR